MLYYIYIYIYIYIYVFVSVKFLPFWYSISLNFSLLFLKLLIHLSELIVNSVILLFVNEFDEQVHGIVGILKSRWLEEVQEEAESFSEQLCHEHVQVSMMTNIDEKEDDSPGDANKSSVYAANASGMRPSSKVNVGSQEEVTRLLQSMQNRIEVLERNAGFQSPPAPQAGDHEEDDGPITQGTSSCTIQ